ncbi:hypothetical protein EJ06DRAFT_354806 [Trichodelitschia bisporula]|uniref:Uncharacterized protein n=1 Tax=Trichodelitschia bisporula TaxID=703511 RepID=A0A6G1I052_9PEZI|nr:hypothetical protein EJ06DRAFT_354806 [Trichodelitschia bisporula]
MATVLGAPRSNGLPPRIHKRDNSASSIGLLSSPPLPNTAPIAAAAEDEASTLFPPFKRAGTDARKIVTYDDDIDADARPPRIKPYLRKQSLGADAPAGLGIHDFGVTPSARTVSDPMLPPTAASRHARSTSNTSQFSTTSARPAVPFAHTLRQAPRPYTPPIAKSYTTSVVGSEVSNEAADVLADEEDLAFRISALNAAGRRSESISSIPAHAPPLPISSAAVNNPSLTRLHAASTSSGTYTFGGTANHSQSSLPSLLPSGGRTRGDTMRSNAGDTTSPSSRSSLDRAMAFIRGRGAEPEPDPATSIRAMRIAYAQREEAKDLKAEKESLKKLERDAKKRAKREQQAHSRRKSSSDTGRGRVRGDSKSTHRSGGSGALGGSNEKVEFVPGKPYSAYTPAHARSLPARVDTISPPRMGGGFRNGAARRARSGRLNAKSTWLGFMAWLRTRFLRWGKKMHVTT